MAVAAPVHRVWSALTDWARQGEWMLGTTVRPTSGDGQGVGGGIEAFTGIGRLGVLDVMEITVWDPPHRCHVLHVGRLLRGTGEFEVAPHEGGSIVRWREDLRLPLGGLGRAAWWVVGPLARYGVRRSLRAFARQLEGNGPSQPPRGQDAG